MPPQTQLLFLLLSQKYLVNGSFSFTVPITNDPDVSPLNYNYLFEESFEGGRTYLITTSIFSWRFR